MGLPHAGIRARFKIWSDGAITPIAEEIPELRRLNETDLEDRGAEIIFCVTLATLNFFMICG